MTLSGTTAEKGQLSSEMKPSDEDLENETLNKFDENSVVIIPVNAESKKLRQILSNDTSMKILDLLKKEKLSASEVAEKLELPLTTVKYNIDQLVEHDLAFIHRIKYSEKGRQVKIYEAMDKIIIFAPEKVNRTSLASILQKYAFAFVAAAFAGFGLNYIYRMYLNKAPVDEMSSYSMDEAGGAIPMSATERIVTDESTFRESVISFSDWFFDLINYHFVWFIAGALFVCIIIWVFEYIAFKGEKADQ